MSPSHPRARCGAGAVEFALTLPILLSVFLGIVELSLLMHRHHLVTRAARDACRLGTGVLEGVDPTGDDIEEAAVEHGIFALESAGVDCTSGCTVTGDWHELEGLQVLTVVVRVDYEPVTGLMPMLPDQLRSEFTMLTQQQLPEELEP